MKEDRVHQAIELIRAGDRTGAQRLLLDVTRDEPENINAWYVLAACVEDLDQRELCLKKVLAINPNHAKASHLLENLHKERAAGKILEQPTILEQAVQDGPVFAENSTGPAEVNDQNKEYLNHSIPNKSNNRSHIITLISFAILVLAVAWLWYRVDNLEKRLVSMQALVDKHENQLVSMQALVADLGTQLAYVEALAENADSYAHSHNYWSDSRLKTDVRPVNDVLEKIETLHVVSYQWTDDARNQFGLGTEREVGLIAQEVEAVFPELVTVDSFGFRHVDYSRLSSLLVEAIHAQQAKIERLENRIEILEAR